ncbi:MAG: hypothetical protein AB7V46_20295 [Thermomicrobiales bacterium]
MGFPFRQRDSLAEHARQLQLKRYTPKIELEGLVTGIDNQRYDVFLSPPFVAQARQHVSALIAKYGRVEDMAVVAQENPPVAPSRQLRPPQQRVQPQRSPEPPDFKRSLTDLLVASLNRAKAEGNQSVDVLLRLAIIKFLRAETAAQFAVVLERCRAKAQSYEGPIQTQTLKSVEFRERLAAFQLAKAPVLRKASQELFHTLREVEKETLARMRRALFGDTEHAAYAILLNRLLFTDDGRDDQVNAEQYVMLGKYDHDPDRFQPMITLAREFLLSLELVPAEGEDQVPLDSLMNVPENAQELVAGGIPDDSTPKGRAQKALLTAWMEVLERNDVLEYVIAAYESAALLAE